MRTNMRRRKSNVIKRKIGFTTVISLVFIVSLLLLNNTVTEAVTVEDLAHGSGKQLTTIVICEGDSLWKLANKYGAVSDPQRFILEVQKVNRLDSPVIYPGQSLVIPLI